MARELFNAEQLGPQGRLARAGARTRKVGHPVLKAQWQSLHVILLPVTIPATIWPQESIPGQSRQVRLSGTGQAGQSSVPARADRAKQNNPATLAMISPMMMRFIPDRRYGVLPPATIAAWG
jgi:hypothetical protein